MERESPSDAELLSWITEKLKKGVSVSLITVIEKMGSAPRGVGTKMAISEDGEQFGTLGGGELERIAYEKALERIIERSPKVMKVNLFRSDVVSDDVISTKSQICGGQVTLFIDVLNPRPRSYIIGAGHLARSLTLLLNMLGFQITVIDNMPEYADKKKLPWADEIVINSDLSQAVKSLEFSDRDVVIVMHGNADVELEALYSIYTKNRLPGYIGLVSGRGKLAYILKGLISRGVDKSLIMRTLYSPVGLSIGGETPEEIAISIAAEILKVSRGGEGLHNSIVRELLEKLDTSE